MTRQVKFIFVIFITFLVNLNAAIIQNDKYNFSLDIPEGYNLKSSTKDGKSFSFTHPNISVTLILKIFDNVKSNPKQILNENLIKLKNKSEGIDTFMWNGKENSISELNFNIDKSYNGWATCSPLKSDNSYLVMLCYCPEEDFEICNQFIISTLNSLCVDNDFYCDPGIILSYAFPKTEIKEVNFKLFGKDINTKLDSSDEEASQYLVDLEFSVLSLYIQHKLWKEAWQRYYRIIFRDSFGRMYDCIEQVLKTFIPYAKAINPEKPELTMAQFILTWVQSMEYKERNKEIIDSDFTSLPRVLCGNANDCDSRALFVCLFTKAMGLESFILISPEYSHALAAVEIDAPGQKYIPEGTNREFLMGETTEKVTWGMIAQDQADRTKWFPAYLP